MWAWPVEIALLQPTARLSGSDGIAGIRWQYRLNGLRIKRGEERAVGETLAARSCHH